MDRAAPFQIGGEKEFGRKPEAAFGSAIEDGTGRIGSGRGPQQQSLLPDPFDQSAAGFACCKVESIGPARMVFVRSGNPAWTKLHFCFRVIKVLSLCPRQN